MNGRYVMPYEMKIPYGKKGLRLVDETILKARDFTAVKPDLPPLGNGGRCCFRIILGRSRHNDIIYNCRLHESGQRCET